MPYLPFHLLGHFMSLTPHYATIFLLFITPLGCHPPLFTLPRFAILPLPLSFSRRHYNAGAHAMSHIYAIFYTLLLPLRYCCRHWLVTTLLRRHYIVTPGLPRSHCYHYAISFSHCHYFFFFRHYCHALLLLLYAGAIGFAIVITRHFTPLSYTICLITIASPSIISNISFTSTSLPTSRYYHDAIRLFINAFIVVTSSGFFFE